MTEIYHRHHKKFPDITLLRNIDREYLHPLDDDISCYFGNYAAHAHIGSWKWETKIGWNPVPEKRTGNYNSTTDPNALSLIRDIDSIIASKAVKSIYLEKINMPGKELPFDLDVIYQYLAKHCYFNTQGPAQRVVFHTGGASMPLDTVSKNNTNILITTGSDLPGFRQFFETVNRCFTACFVLNESQQKSVVGQGITIPVIITNHFYLQIKRAFEEEHEGNVKKDRKKYTVGFYCDSEADYLYIYGLAEKMNYLKNGIAFLLLYRNKPQLIRKMKGFGYKKLDRKNLSNNLNSIHCFLAAKNTHLNSLLLYTNLYLGNPVVTVPENADSKTLKYCKVCNENNAGKAVLDLKTDYAHYNKLSVKAGAMIEDTCSVERMASKIVVTASGLKA